MSHVLNSGSQLHALDSFSSFADFPNMKTQLNVIRDELVAVARQLEEVIQTEEGEFLLEVGVKLEEAANAVGKAWCGSWLGYHSRVYYADLVPPPPSAFFDREWGLMPDTFSSATHGDWRIFNSDALQDDIRQLAGVDDPKPQWLKVKALREAIKDAKDSVLSCFITYLEVKKDAFIERLQKEVENSKAPSTQDFYNHLRPQGQIMSRDSAAFSEGFTIPPHIIVKCQALETKGAVMTARSLSKFCYKAAAHIDKFSLMNMDSKKVGQKVFIGHGRSLLWRELKDFIADRLHLQWDEFNRVSVAGITTISRLESMLQEAAFAFLIMTAEDELVDARLHPRQNVVHEAGLFQGRLGFTRAIILLEEGCEEFSNIAGLSQIRFPKGNIKACFEEVRQVLERERLL